MSARKRLLAVLALALAVLAGRAAQPDDARYVQRYYGKGQFWEAWITQTVTEEGLAGRDDPHAWGEFVVRYIGPAPVPAGPITFGYEATLSGTTSSGSTLDRNGRARILGRFQLLPDETIPVTVEWDGQRERFEMAPASTE
ncbi:MAG TPA: hypothetical protein VIK99_05750 [Thermaerobacter sp.]